MSMLAFRVRWKQPLPVNSVVPASRLTFDIPLGGLIKKSDAAFMNAEQVETKALMLAGTASEGDMFVVYADPVEANNGYYEYKNGQFVATVYPNVLINAAKDQAIGNAADYTDQEVLALAQAADADATNKANAAKAQAIAAAATDASSKANAAQSAAISAAASDAANKAAAAESNAKGYADLNRIFKPASISAAIDFNNYKTFGFWYFVSGAAWDASTNKPTGISNQWAFMLVLPISPTVVGQYIWCLNSLQMTYRYCNAANVWSAWSVFSDDATLTTSIKNAITSNLKTTLQISYESNSKNWFDASAVIPGYEVFSNGSLSVEANSVASGLIYCKDQSSIAVSGLQDNTSIRRYYRFLDAKNQLVSVGQMTAISNQQLITVPAGAVWFQIAVKQRNTEATNLATVQIEYGSAISAYVAFNQGDIIGIYGTPVKRDKTTLTYKAGTKNLLDKNALLIGTEVYSNGTLLPEATSVTTDLIEVTGLAAITISGLQANPEIGRYYRFLDAAKAIQTVGQIPKGAVSWAITVPAGAVWFQSSVLQRTATVLDSSALQVESGTTATAYVAYSKVVSGINGTALGAGSTTQASRAYGAKYLLFGDSITQTSNVDGGVFDQINNPFTNWPTFAKAQLQMSVFRNYAKSGASFKEVGQTNEWQKLGYQVSTAITNAETPDVIIVACGTNDGISALGSYATAMGKTTLAALDKSLTIEAMRWSFWKIKTQWPNAVCFVSLPLQRADDETATRQPLLDAISQMAKRYGFQVIDAHSDSGIVKDFEVWQASGRDLADGLHPNDSGKQKLANLIVSRVVARMTY